MNIFLSLARLFFALFLFSIPFSTRILIWDSNSLNAGVFNEYSSYFIYIPEIFLVLALFFLGLVFLKKPNLLPQKNKAFEFLFIFFTIAVFSCLFAKDKSISFFWSLRFLELSSIFLFYNPKVFPRKAFWKVVSYSLLFQIFIASLQFILGRSLGLGFLGEFQFEFGQKGVAVLNFPFGKIPRAYGTFSHPNVLGAVSTLAFFLFFHLKEVRTLGFLKKSIPFMLIGIFLSFSKSAALALFLGSSFFLIKDRFKNKDNKILIISILVSILIFLVRFLELGSILENESINGRFMLILPSFQIFSENIFGVGIGNFTLHLIQKNPLNYWQLHPVHNVFLLILTELGIVGFLFLAFSFYKIIRNCFKKPEIISFLLVIFITGFFDHFWLTNFACLSFLYVFTYRFSIKSP